MKTITARSTYGTPVTEEVRAEAIARGRQRSLSHPHATALRYLRSQRAIELDFADRTAIRLPVERYSELATLTDEELSRLELGFGGSVLCLADRDLHVSIAGLVAESKPLNEVAAAVVSVRVGDNVWARRPEGVQFSMNVARAYKHVRNITWALSQVNLNETYDVQYWTKALGVSEEQLRQAIRDSTKRPELKRKSLLSALGSIAKKALGPT